MYGKSVNFEDMPYIYNIPLEWSFQALFSKTKAVIAKQVLIFTPNCKHLGYFNHIFRFLRLQQCDQGMLPNRLFWKFIEELLFSLASIFFQRTYLATFLALQSRNSSRDRWVKWTKEWNSPAMQTYGLMKDTNLIIEGSFSTTLCSK